MESVNEEKLLEQNKNINREDFKKISEALEEYRRAGGPKKGYDLPLPFSGPPLVPDDNNHRQLMPDDRYSI